MPAANANLDWLKLAREEQAILKKSNECSRAVLVSKLGTDAV